MRLPPKCLATCLLLLVILALTPLCTHGGQQGRDHTPPLQDEVIVVLQQLPNVESLGDLTIIYPLDGTLFPPELVPPTFRWEDKTSGVDSWVIRIAFEREDEILTFRARQANWSPEPSTWENIKRRSRDNSATLTIFGVGTSSNQVVHSSAALTFSTSADPVGAPIFYREVNLPFVEAVKDPSNIRWRFGPISSAEPPPIVLQNLPVCGNCHSFSADGRVLGMDVDYANDKGSYVITEIAETTTLAPRDVITWSDFEREQRHVTFGLLSQVSPDGRYAVSTVNDRSVFVPKDDLAFSQLFFPLRGILAVYDRQTRQFASLPGADDPAFVQSNPAWSPDGRQVVFARSEAYQLRHDLGAVLLTREECREFLDEGKEFRFDLYRVPFNQGKGGVAEPLRGASHNGVSNFFAKYSPNGKWIVFCQAANYMLLQPDSELYIIPAEGGEARRLACNTGRMNSWHSWSPNGKWLVFTSKVNTPYTQLFLTHIDEEGRSTPPVLLEHFTALDRAANIPEFVNADPAALKRIDEAFVDDLSYVRAGDAFQRANDVAGAIRSYRRAVELNPKNAMAHSNLGGLLVNEGKADEGERHLRQALELDSELSAAHYNLGMLHARRGQVSEALKHLSTAARLEPDNPIVRADFGALLCSTGELVEGERQLREALRLDGGNAQAHYALGRLAFRVGMVEQGIEHLEQAVQHDPGHTEARHALARVLLLRGKAKEGLAQLTLAVEHEPDNAELRRELAWLLVTAPEVQLRNPARALAHARRACELTGRQDYEALDVLGACQAALGDFPAAIEAAREALARARAAGKREAIPALQKRLEMYQQGKPYEPPHTP